MLWLLLFLFADQFDTTFRAGLIALNQNDLIAAESHLEAASRLQPRDARVWLALAQTYSKLNKTEAASAAAVRAEELGPDAALLRGLALYYSGIANFAKASELMKAAIRRNPYEENYHFELAQLHLNRQNFAGALEVLGSSRKTFDKSPQLELAAGVAYYGLRRFPEAIDAFLRTILLDPSVEQPYIFLGRVLDQAEDRLPRIAAALATFAKRAPENYLSSFLYGKSLRLTEDTKQAESLVRKSIAQNGNFWEAHFELGILLEQSGRYEESASAIRRAIELNPDEPPPHYRLARLYDRLGKPAEARLEREIHARLAAAVK